MECEELLNYAYEIENVECEKSLKYGHEILNVECVESLKLLNCPVSG